MNTPNKKTPKAKPKTASSPAPAEESAKSAQTREKLLSVAEKLFIERGFDGVSIKDITDKAGTTKGHVYYYFKNKQELFNAVVDRHFERQAAMLMGAVARQGSLSDRIHAGVDAYLDFIEENPGFPRLIQREVCSRSKSTRRIAAGLEPVYRWGAALFADVLPLEGPLASRHFFLNLFSMTLNYYTYSPLLESIWGVNPLAPDALAERRAHIHLMIDGIINQFITSGGKGLKR